MPTELVPARYPSFMPTVVDPPPAVAAVLAEIAEAVDLLGTGDYWRAEKILRRVDKRHDSPRARALIGLILEWKGQGGHARGLLAEGCASDPSDVLIQHNRGAVLHLLGEVADALEAYSCAAESAPQYGPAYIGIGSCFADLMRHPEAVYAYRRAVGADPDNFSYWSDLIFTTDLSDTSTFEDSLAVRRELNDRLLAPLGVGAEPHPNDPDPDRILRVGYTSADMYQHSGAMTWGGWFVHHDKTRVHVTSYCGTVKRDQMTDRFEAATDRWYEVGTWSDERLAAQVRKDRIDILVDLGGYSRGGRLPAFARRPAPIQLSGWGYATGTGLDCMDYFATDALVVPIHEEGRYHERPWRLPSALAWVPPPDVTIVDGKPSPLMVGHVRAALGRPVCFGVFNRQPKITRSCIRAWAAILKRVPGAWLLIKNGRLDSEQVKAAVQRAFEEEGITDPRVMLVGQGNHWDHLAAHWVPDVMLDPFPQGGGVSAFESLWMGVPLISLTGDRPSGRAATSLLHQVDLADWACPDVETYVERAVEAAKDLETLKQIRATLRERVIAMPATQLVPYARAVEDGYRERWKAWCRRTVAERGTLEDGA